MKKNFNHYTRNVIEPNPSAKLHRVFAKVKAFEIPSKTEEAFQSYIQESQMSKITLYNGGKPISLIF